MNRKLAISIIVMFVLSMVFGFLIHGLALHGEYVKLNMMRSESEQQKLFGFMLIAHLCIAAGFSWLYIKGREAKPWLGQGVRFGLGVVVLMTIPMYLIYHVVMPFPTDVVAQQIVYDAIAVIVMGIVVAWINR